MGSLTKKDKTANAGLEEARKILPPDPQITAATVEVTIQNAPSGSVYLGWTPIVCSIRITNQPQPDLSVTLRNKDVSRGGQVTFRTGYSAAEQNTLTLTVPGNGTAVNFFVGGKFGSPSVDDQDGGIAVTETPTRAIMLERTLMVRVRKNANNLTPGERNRFLSAFQALNNSAATYQLFLNGHNRAADGEIHGRPSFLPWHRAFILDLERRLQDVDSSVSLPYWRFDQPAPNVFHRDFMGEADATGRVTLSSSNPISSWAVPGLVGIIRMPLFDTVSSGGNVMNQNDTLALGTTFTSFREMEVNPHGWAHVSFSSGRIRSPWTATEDPLFFLLHCNVDRLWAYWQKEERLFDPSNSNAYSIIPIGDDDPANAGIGDNLADTMWPWNGAMGGERPTMSGFQPMPQLPPPLSGKPSAHATVGEMIDYIGRTQGNSNFFCYDDVPFL